MSETLYRKYRPKNFSEVIGQAHIVRTLSNAIKNNHIGQAYLFTGPRGTGKTSVARILAKAVNCQSAKDAISCEKCQACDTISAGRSLDIIEIDAASNTGVDNIREVRETVALPPTSLKYKVYIIDEVHMLSGGAFNALLKTLEEPPSHVIFILATTEVHKVPATILSRCQRFDFARLPLPNIVEKLAIIAKAEKIKVEKEALELVAIAAEGGMRDAESILAQIIALEDKEITVKEVEEILGTTDKKFAYELAGYLAEKNSTAAIASVNAMASDGYDLVIFTKMLINHLRQLMLLKINPELKKHFTYEMTREQIDQASRQAQKMEVGKIIGMIHLFLEAQGKISSSILPQLPLEIAIIKATQTLPEKTLGVERGTRIKEDVETANSASKPEKEQPEKNQASGRQNIKPIEYAEARQDSPLTPVGLDIDKVKENWNKLLIDISPYNHSINALLSTCQIQMVKGAQITIATPYEFYKDKLNEQQNRLTIEDVFSKILGSKISIITVVDKSIKPKSQAHSEPPEESHEQSSLLDSAMEILGGKVVEE